MARRPNVHQLACSGATVCTPPWSSVRHPNRHRNIPNSLIYRTDMPNHQSNSARTNCAKCRLRCPSKFRDKLCGNDRNTALRIKLKTLLLAICIPRRWKNQRTTSTTTTKRFSDICVLMQKHFCDLFRATVASARHRNEQDAFRRLGVDGGAITCANHW